MAGVVAVMAVVAATATVTSGFECPILCSCKWKDGKQAALCEGQDGGKVLRDLDAATQVLHLNRSHLPHLPDKAFASHNLTNLQKVFLLECGLRELAPLALANLTNLVELDLSYNLLTAIPATTFQYTPELRHLHLSHNLISHVGEASLDYLTALRLLDLSHCRLTSVAATAFRPLRHLRKLFVDHNQLTHLLPQLVGTLRHLHEFHLHRNPWRCDCRLRRLRQWLAKHPVYSEPPQCASPARLEGRTFHELGEEQFACHPEILPTSHHGVVVDGNVTLWCPVGGLPTPSVTWYVDEQLVQNGSLMGRPGVGSGAGESEDGEDAEGGLGGVVGCVLHEASEERGSLLHLAGLKPHHATLPVRCVATNAAGSATAVFTLEMVAGLRVQLRPEIVAAIVSVGVVAVAGLVAVCSLVIRRRRRYGHTPIPGKTAINGAGDARHSHLPYTPSPYVGGSVVTAAHNSDLLRPPDVSSGEEEEEEEDAGGCISTDEGEALGGGWRAGVHSRSLDEGCGRGWVWEPRRALAVLDSAAPEHVMLRAGGPGSLSSSQHRLSLLPQFAPDYSQLFFTPGPQAAPLVTSHYGTVPRSTRVRPHPAPPNPTLSPTPTTRLAPNPLHTSPPTPCPPHPHHTKLDRITARDSPDEGYQEGAEV